MSGLVAGKVWHSNLPRDIKALAACLADEANDRGEGIYPSIAYIGWKLSTNTRTVQRMMAQLRADGILQKIGVKRFGRIIVPVYRLIVAKLPKRAPWRGREGDDEDMTPQSPVPMELPSKTCGKDGRGDSEDVTKLLPRGDLALSPNPLDIPEEKNKKNLGPQKTRSSPQQKRFAIIGKLARKAETILENLPDYTDGDLAEILKTWAAGEGIPYFDAWPDAAPPIEQAITIARERVKVA
jgi:hypothetical protein